ncbi:uncharacterized protein DUF1707 [Nocardiopsis sp. Huas11]|uniref:DUF1707 SHOCT-like domain-containing protein n=1 Tax=Nocardiopsis sp. Huas11 TaxID=2183912 RepID=UPI000EB1C0BE|nr:DUF1707 domain-containing protein [Nocardiopsis sp. Huas11]RKS04758.1 uncharacterized protein DUF1707 [Nocardiopsis sp. Huas11]
MSDGRLPLHRVRASDAEREATLEHLATAFVEGRLRQDEYELRVGLALRSVFIGDLEDLTGDLPARPHAPAQAPASGPPAEADDPGTRWQAPALTVSWSEWTDEWRWWLGIAVVLTTVWAVVSAMSGELVPYWPLVPLGIWAAVLLASAIWPSEGEPPPG